MGNTLKFNSSVCTSIKQSQRLLDLGLKPETADCFHWEYAGMRYIGNIDDERLTEKDVPAWSLHRLLCLLYPREDVYPIMPTTAYDDIIDEIETEIECGGFNKEYLKQ